MFSPFLKLILLPAALLLIQGCASSEEYRARTSSETARAANTPPAAAPADTAPAAAGSDAPAAPSGPLARMHRSKPYAYSNEAGGLTLGADASQAHLRMEGKDGYLPVGVLVANRSKVDLLLTPQSFSYRKREDGEWQPLPSYQEVQRTTFPSSNVRRQLGDSDAFSTRIAYSAMRRVNFSPFPGSDNIRIDNTSLSSLSYTWFILYIPNPGMTGAAGNHYLRYTDSERHAEISVVFPLIESKR